MSELVDKTINKNTPKDTVTTDELLNIAVKYFSIEGINKESNYVVRTCVIFNDIAKTEIERKPFIEAFCISSILRHYDSEEFNISAEILYAKKELCMINLGITESEKLLRAQGAMYFLMRNNEKLKVMLKTEYERQKEYLPFILTDN